MPGSWLHVRRAVEQTSAGPPTLKAPKNGKTRTAIFPRSFAIELQTLVDDVTASAGPEGLLFPNRSGGIMRRSSFQQVWIKAAHAAGWPMTTPLRRSAGYGETNKGWRWTGAAQGKVDQICGWWSLVELAELEEHVPRGEVAIDLGVNDRTWRAR